MIDNYKICDACGESMRLISREKRNMFTNRDVKFLEKK